MSDINQYEAFLLKTKTADNFSVIVGGFCPTCKKEESINNYMKLNNYKLGQSKDAYLIDYLLADVIRRISPSWVIVVGASISIDGVNASTGGILGNPFKQVESADKDIEEIIEGMYLITFPGGPGTAFTGIQTDANMLHNKILEYKSGNCSIENIMSLLDDISNLYIFVEDGSGLMNCGGIYVSDYRGKKHETFSD